MLTVDACWYHLAHSFIAPPGNSPIKLCSDDFPTALTVLRGDSRLWASVSFMHPGALLQGRSEAFGGARVREKRKNPSVVSRLS